MRSGTHTTPGSPNTQGFYPTAALAALGVVFGDIGTSPLYALRECLNTFRDTGVTEGDILGLLSLIFWALILLVSLKYVSFVMRADNNGEGGVLSLMSLGFPERRYRGESATTPERRRGASRARQVFTSLGIFGAALLYGDGMLTPAITVLSAIEGLEVATPAFSNIVVPITVVILVALFFVQQYGTAKIGAVFGPILLVWFSALAIFGVRGILDAPQVLHAVNPMYSISFLMDGGWRAFAILGSVFLVITGGEALYADMGHFGLKPIRVGWFLVVLPALVLNYFGQGALLLKDPSAAANPFFYLVPRWALYLMIVLATLASIVASQAVISGSFSLTRQAIQLGYLPRLVIRHTSSEEIGQIFVPKVNWLLLIATIWLVVAFRSSANLAGAYGIAVSTTMVITTLLMFTVASRLWKWSILGTLVVVIGFSILDVSFFVANLTKIAQGGWFPLAVGALFYVLMTTWRQGRKLLGQRLQSRTLPLQDFLRRIERDPPLRIPGTAVFMTGQGDGTPPALTHNTKHNRVLHQRVIIMMVATENRPHVSVENRLEVERLGEEFYRITCYYGFQDTPNVPGALRLARGHGLELNLDEITFYLGRETLLATRRPGMAIWREKLFAFLSANSERATAFFRIPPDQVVEIGMQVEL